MKPISAAPLRPDQRPEGWSAAAAGYRDAFAGFTAKFAEEAVRLTEIRAGERVLDVAAGTGALTIAAARRGADVLGTDFAAGMLAELRARLAEESIEAETALMDGQALELEDATFDAAFSCFGLIFFPDLPRGFAELHRVLKPGGRAGVVCWGCAENFEIMQVLRESLERAAPGVAGEQEPLWARLSQPGALAAHMSAAGFGNIELHTLKRSWESDDIGALWHFAARASPPLAVLFAELGDDRAASVGEAMRAILAEKFADGGVSLSCEAVIGIGTK